MLVESGLRHWHDEGATVQLGAVYRTSALQRQPSDAFGYKLICDCMMMSQVPQCEVHITCTLCVCAV